MSSHCDEVRKRNLCEEKSLNSENVKLVYEAYQVKLISTANQSTGPLSFLERTEALRELVGECDAVPVQNVIRIPGPLKLQLAENRPDLPRQV